MSSEVVDRQMVLLRACWSVFDKVRSQVSSEMRRGPRGGGRDRDQIVRHVLVNEQQWARKLGMRSQDGEAPTDDHRVRSFRDDYCGAIRLFQAENKPARTWPLRYLVRHTAYHAMDHTWDARQGPDRPHFVEPSQESAPEKWCLSAALAVRWFRHLASPSGHDRLAGAQAETAGSCPSHRCIATASRIAAAEA